MTEKIIAFFSGLPRELYVFVISILPIVELRGAIPVGAAIGLPFYVNYLVAVLGNLLPVPFILAFIPFVLDFMVKHGIFPKLVHWIRAKAEKHKDKIIKGDDDIGKARLTRTVFLALMLFVAVPLPGTGAWTGSLVASLFDLPKRSSFLAVALGVLISGVIMCLASYGVLGFLNFLI